MKIKLSNTSKMPCKSFGIPSGACLRGSKLAKIIGTICNKCYADKGAYKWAKVENAYQNRLNQYNECNNGEWLNEAIKTIKRQKSDCFRWFDSGDLQSKQMLLDIITIAINLPHISFWLPTRERYILQDVLKDGYRIPSNLVIRISDDYIDKKLKLSKALKGFPQSGATTDKDKANCRAFENNGECGNCRKCWDKEEKYQVYLLH